MPRLDSDKRCPFCGREPMSIHDIYPEAKDDSLTCPGGSGEVGKGCPASGTWVDKETWNRRAGPEMEALRRLRDLVPSDQKDEDDPAVVMFSVAHYIDALKGMLEADAEEINRLSALVG